MRMSSLSGRRSLPLWVVGSVIVGMGAAVCLGVIWLQPSASSRSAIEGPRPVADGSATAAGSSNASRAKPGPEFALHRPERICAGLVVLDVQIGPDKEIEGAWLATGPRQSPRMVALGQRFGPGVLRHARLDEETDLPEVWMQSADVTCRASLPEEEWARTLTTEPSAVQPGSARGGAPTASVCFAEPRRDGTCATKCAAVGPCHVRRLPQGAGGGIRHYARG